MANQDSVYEISSFTGLSDYEDRGHKGAFKFGANLNVRKETDSLSCNQALLDEGLLGSRSPSLSVSPSVSTSYSPSLSNSISASPSTGESPSPSTTPSVSVSLSPSVTPSSSVSPSPSPTAGLNTVFQDLILWFVKATDGYTYGFGDLGYIYRRDADGVWLQVYKDPNGKIKGAAEWFNHSGEAYLYWATDRQLNRKKLPGKSNWNDVNASAGWPKLNLNSCDWHTMAQSGGSLLICNKEWLALVGYDDSYTNEAVDLVPGNVAKTLVERSGRAIIGTYRTSDPLNGINASIDSEVPLSQVGNGNLYFANMTDSIPIKRLPGGGRCYPGGVVNQENQVNYFEWEQDALSWIDKQAVGNLALFAVHQADAGRGGIYSYGRTNKNKDFTLNLDYQFDADELGALTSVDGTILVSYREGSVCGVKAVDPDTKAAAIYEGIDFKSPIKPVEGNTTWKYAEVFMAPLPDGATVEFWYRVNKTGPFIRALTASGENAYRIKNGKKATFIIQATGDIYEPRVVLNPTFNTGPEAYRIRTYFA